MALQDSVQANDAVVLITSEVGDVIKNPSSEHLASWGIENDDSDKAIRNITRHSHSEGVSSTEIEADKVAAGNIDCDTTVVDECYSTDDENDCLAEIEKIVFGGGDPGHLIDYAEDNMDSSEDVLASTSLGIRGSSAGQINRRGFQAIETMVEPNGSQASVATSFADFSLFTYDEPAVSDESEERNIYNNLDSGDSNDDDSNDNDSDDDDDDIEAYAAEGAAALHHEMESIQSASSADASDVTDEDVLMPPKDTFSMVRGIFDRQHGLGRGWPMKFSTQCVGSVGLVQRFQQAACLEHHTGCVNALHFNQAGTLLASGSDDLSIVVWNWARKKPYFVFESGHKSNVFQCKFLPFSNDSAMVTCARDGQVRLAELSVTGVCKDTRKIAQHRGAAHKLALRDDSPHVFYSCGEDGEVFEIDVRETKYRRFTIKNDEGKKLPLYSIHANPFKPDEFVVAGRDFKLRLYDVRMLSEGQPAAVTKKLFPNVALEGQASITCAVFNWNGTEILASYNDDDIYLFDNTIPDMGEVHRYSGHRNNATVKGVNFYGQRSEFVVSGSDCGHVYLWEKDSEKVVNFFKADVGGVVNVLEPHPSGAFLATSGLDNDIKIWMPTREEKTNLKGFKKQKRLNFNERLEERTYHQTDMMHHRMIWMLMNHFQRSHRGEDEEDSSNSESDDSGSDGGNQILPCATS